MGRSGRIAAVAAFLVATVFAFAPVRPAPVQNLCYANTGFCYQGAHWRITELPVRVRLEMAGKPATISNEEFVAAAVAAAAAWNAVWPYPGTNQAGCLVPPGGIPATAICIEAIGSPTSPNVVSWGFSSGLATTTRCIGTSPSACTPTTGGGHIAQATIVIDNSPSRTWKYLVPDGASEPELRVMAYQAGLGEVRGAMNGFCPPYTEFLCNAGWYDLGNLLTHEFGHFLGLNHTTGQLDWMQTMHPDIYMGETSKRTLHYGDIAGIQLVAADSLASVTEP